MNWTDYGCLFVSLSRRELTNIHKHVKKDLIIFGDGIKKSNFFSTRQIPNDITNYIINSIHEGGEHRQNETNSL